MLLLVIPVHPASTLNLDPIALRLDLRLRSLFRIDFLLVSALPHRVFS